MSTAQRTTPRPAQRLARSPAPRTFSSSCAKARWACSEQLFAKALALTPMSAQPRTLSGFERIAGPGIDEMRLHANQSNGQRLAGPRSPEKIKLPAAPAGTNGNRKAASTYADRVI